MKLELHILQNFAPSCLNRDDTNAPKDCEFGGFRRARISSQCIKRSIRDAFDQHSMLTSEEIAVRTKRLIGELADRVVAATQCDPQQALDIAKAALGGAGLAPDKKDGSKTQYLLFMPKRNIDKLADVIVQHFDVLQGVKPAEDAAEASEDDAAGEPKKGRKKASAKQDKQKAKDAVPKDIKDKLTNLLEDDAKTPELALFGRMIADKPDWNTDASCQVAHAISTNRVSMEFDFYTAIDDLKKEDTSGSDMMGTVQFNSACFYRYAVVDIDDLAKNLAGSDKDATKPEVRAQAQKTLEAFVKASVLAIPTGKQNSMAAHNPPGFVLAVLRDAGAPCSLANAFVQPVRSSFDKNDGDLVSQSIHKLDEHLDQALRMYGRDGLKLVWCAMNDKLADLKSLTGEAQQGSIQGLIDAVSQTAFGARAS